MKHQRIIGIAFFLCLLVLLTGCGPSFAGKTVKTGDSYVLDITAMNGSDYHVLDLEQGDTLRVQFEREKGSLRMEITSPNGTAIYQGDGTTVNEFTINVSADGIYAISVQGEKAQGKIRVDVERGSNAAE